MGDPSAQDIRNLTSAINNLNRSIKGMVDGLYAANTNLVALHDQVKEMNAQNE